MGRSRGCLYCCYSVGQYCRSPLVFLERLDNYNFGCCRCGGAAQLQIARVSTGGGTCFGNNTYSLFFGLLIKALVPDFDKSPLRSLGAIAIASIVMSLLLAIAEKIGKRNRTYEKLTIPDGILMGLAQAIALIPGCSRSGSTLTAGLFIGLERPAAARFSFLLGIPAITLAGLVELKGALGQGIGDAGVAALIVGTISAFVFSYLSIAWLMKFLQAQNTWVFVWYRLAFGVAILTALAGGAVNNI